MWMGLKKDEDIKRLRGKTEWEGEATKCWIRGGGKSTALDPG